MLKISRNASVTISLIMSVIFFLAVIAGLFAAPKLVQVMLDTPDYFGNRESITDCGRGFVLAVTYIILVLIALADILMFLILRSVRNSAVFTDSTVAYIRYVSWLCILVGCLFFSVGVYITMAIIAGFAAVFGGFCIRVVKNVIEEATAIKSENDLTV